MIFYNVRKSRLNNFVSEKESRVAGYPYKISVVIHRFFFVTLVINVYDIKINRLIVFLSFLL